MRATACVTISFTVLTAAAALLAVGCGGGGRRTEQSFALDSAPSASQPDGLAAQVLHFKQRDGYLLVNLRLSNTGKDAITLKNPGSTLIGFTATAEGRSVAADKRGGRGYWNPWTGYVMREGTQNGDVLELPPGITTEIELRWEFRPPLPKNDYDWTITIGQAFQGEKKLPELKIAYPSAAPAASAPVK